ncbi:MAG: hypothetical protein GKR93_10695 [Gammaproteobacteria bacterium]|nr:hypothetical protein [Gammaproteobacteria bacterium]
MTDQVVDPREEAFKKIRMQNGIEVIGGELHLQVDALEQVLIEHPDCGIYQRGGLLVEISEIPITNCKNIKRPEGTKAIVQVKVTRIREKGTEYATWKRYDNRIKANKNIDCPRDVARTLAERNSWRLPVLRGVIGAATITETGRLLTQHGYDFDTALYLESKNWIRIEREDNLTKEDAVKALDKLREIISEFPFIDAAAESVWFAALLTALIRWSLRTAPFFGFDAPVMGSGKTFLATLISLLVNGQSPAVMTLPRDETEMGKGLLAVLLAGDPVLVIDNVENIITSETLCTISTSPIFKGRLLGETKIIAVSTAVVLIITGNNLTIRGDLSTRILISRLDPVVEHPEERIFKRSNLRDYVLTNRYEFVNAALTLLKAYQVAGRPDTGLKPFGRFEEWDALVRSPLVWAGAADPCETRSRVEQIDPDREQLGEFLLAWWDLYKDKEVLVRQMAMDISSGGDEMHDALRDVIHVIAADGNKINTRRLGRRISRWEGRVCEGLRITRGGEVHRAQAWHCNNQ